MNVIRHLIQFFTTTLEFALQDCIVNFLFFSHPRVPVPLPVPRLQRVRVPLPVRHPRHRHRRHPVPVQVPVRVPHQVPVQVHHLLRHLLPLQVQARVLYQVQVQVRRRLLLLVQLPHLLQVQAILLNPVMDPVKDPHEHQKAQKPQKMPKTPLVDLLRNQLADDQQGSLHPPILPLLHQQFVHEQIHPHWHRYCYQQLKILFAILPKNFLFCVRH
mmetsp:Transcript_36940/g.40040  ORF Transcript_36940/g.40040 Transcript_36940/m.40040 type:complete len:215 (+) Transcript_36940:119-763(+)